MLGSHEPLTVYWFLIVPTLLLQTMFNTGAALIVARMGGSVQDVSELIPFLLRVSRYFCGVMYMVTTLPAKIPEWGLKVLSLNPPAVYISLTRVALMQTYRQTAPGNQPYNAAKCALFHHNPGINPSLQAYCHPIVTNPQLWAWAIGWGVVFLVLGVVFFWQAEHKYGRG
jgi:teichoic acid transport system permease protein